MKDYRKGYTMSKPRIRRNQSRIEFLANKALVESLLEQGFDKKRIFESLQKNGAFSMSYSAFCRICAKFMPRRLPKPISSPRIQPTPALPVPQTNSTPVPVPTRSGPQILGKMERVNPASPSTYIKEDLA